MSKIIQIAVAGIEENRMTQAEVIVFALNDNGEVLMTNNRDIINKVPWKVVPLTREYS